jgi:cytoskeleton protein RodZ
MTLGAYLKSEREVRGVLLADIARETKIGVRMLEAIEQDRFEILPGGVFRSSFIKSYARFLGLDAEKLLLEFPVPSGLPDVSELAEKKTPYIKHPKDRIRSLAALGAGIVIVLGLIIYLLFFGGVKERLYSSRPPASALSNRDLQNPPPAVPAQIQQQPGATAGAPGSAVSSASQALPAPGLATPPAGTAAVPAAPPAPLKVLGELAKKPESTTPASGAALPPSSVLDLNILITERAWIWVGSGDTTLFSGVLETNSTRKFPLNSILILKVGNAAGVQLSVNDQRFVPLGKSGEVRVLQISPDNYQQYLHAPPVEQ